VVVLSQAVTATINAADDGIPKATLKLPRRLNATPDVGFKTESTTPAAEQSVGEEIEYGITTTAVGRHPVPAESTVEPESQPQMESALTLQVVETIRLGPGQVEQAVQGIEPVEDQVEPATHELGPLLEQTVSAAAVQADVTTAFPEQVAQAVQGAVPALDHVEPATQVAGAPQTVFDVAVQTDVTTLFAPEQVEQAVQGAIPAEDQVEPATQDTAGTHALMDVLPGGDV
jgi:hypothetical protein